MHVAKSFDRLKNDQLTDIKFPFDIFRWNRYWPHLPKRTEHRQSLRPFAHFTILRNRKHTIILTRNRNLILNVVLGTFFFF